MELKAKSIERGNQSLLEHSKMVSQVATSIAKLNLERDRENILLDVKLCALLHDIGKATTGFQRMLNNPEVESSGNKYQHNQIGWAFLKRFTHLSERLLSCVYWHHGLYNDDEINSDLILNDLEEVDINLMLSFIEEVQKEVDIPLNEFGDNDAIRPRYYLGNKQEDMYQAFIRYCVISADKLVSEHNITDITQIDGVIGDIINKPVHEITQAPYGESERWETQKWIVDVADKTTMVKAPAGFGKTLVGLLWNLKSTKKLIWVCPRNVVAESVYDSILKELENMQISTTMEIYLTGEVKKANHKSKGFDSEIIITNIDNYLNPSLDNNDAHKLYMINSCDVIFDEYHELVDDSALFGCFLNIMRLRHRLTNSNTLLLSATPIPMQQQWDFPFGKTKVLPEDGISHFKAAHTKRYRVRVMDNDVKSISGLVNNTNFEPNSLMIVNSVRNAQSVRNSGFSKLFHSYYEPADRSRILSELYDSFGKRSTREDSRGNVISSHIIQASMDISFQHLFESVISPESTLQRIGRCDRWGDYNETPTITVFNSTDRGENIIKDVIYDKNLTTIWFNYLANKLGGVEFVTLDEMYVIYNQFIIEHLDILKRYIERRASESIGNMAQIYSRKYNLKGNGDIKVAGANRLRTSSKEFFYIVEKTDGTGWSTVFSHKVRREGDIRSEFKENFDLEFILRAMETMNDDRYDFSEILKPRTRKHMTHQKLLNYARISKTPYLRFDRVYHPILGVVDRNII
jgi:CRISPR-associated endonuclease Cas3-HD